MSFFTFDYSILALLLAALAALPFLKGWKGVSSPSISFPLLKDLLIPAYKGRADWIGIPRVLYQIALFLFALALLDPRIKTTAHEKKGGYHTPTEGIGIYLVLDQSGSMADKTSLEGPSKMEVMKSVTEQFINERPNDLIGLVTFARTAQVVYPLTLDHDVVYNAVQQLDVVKNPDEDGTSLGYAIYKTAHLISVIRQKARAEMGYDMKGAIIILVTDGFQDPNPLDIGNRFRTIDLAEAGAFAKKEKVRLYMVNVDPLLASQEFAPHRRLLKQLTDETGGKFYQVLGGNSLKDVYTDINQLEQGGWYAVKAQSFSYRTFSFYPYLIFLGLVTMLAGWLLETIYLRKTP